MFAKQGHIYIGGADAPFFVTKSMISSEAKKQGFDQVLISDRSDFPSSQLPSGIPSKGWNTVARGRRVAPDGEVSLPSAVKWFVDITPLPPPAPQPPPPQPIPVTTANIPTISWFPFPVNKEPPPSLPSGPTGQSAISVPKGLALPIWVGAGVIGGAFFGYQAISHFFVEGTTSQEKKHILMYAATVLAGWGAIELLTVDKAWWLSPEGIAQKVTGTVGQ